MPTLAVGCAARYDTFSGLIPCKVLKIERREGFEKEWRPCTAQTVTIKITRTVAAYEKGEIIETTGLNVIPPRAIRRRQYSTVILGYLVA